MSVDETKTIILNKNEDDTCFVEITYKRKRLSGNIEERSYERLVTENDIDWEIAD